MKSKKIIFSKFKLLHIFAICGLPSIFCVTTNTSFAKTGVAQRVAVGTSNRAIPRANIANRISTPTEQVTEVIVETETTNENNDIIIENKSSQFNSILNNTASNSDGATFGSNAEMIQNQIAAFAAAENLALSNTNNNSNGSFKNSCDTNLRNCMKKKCNNDFSKCAGDGDTVWGDKLNSCKRDSGCDGEEFKLFATEIKADRDFNAMMKSYSETINCGNKYNTCIINKCGADFKKCLGKSASDIAISECTRIAPECKQIDNGLSGRTQQVFGTLRNNASVQAQKDEERLYELRDLMSKECKKFGAAFDERSLDCVFTINFFADNSSLPMASRKSYAGDSFDCNQDWFGIDVTTFKENAYRLTREQTAASSAMMGAGVGIAAGAISSGSIGRALDSNKAEKALNTAKKENADLNSPETSVQETISTEPEKDKKTLKERLSTIQLKKEKSSTEPTKSETDKPKLKERITGIFNNNKTSTDNSTKAETNKL